MILVLTCCTQTYIDVRKQEIINSIFSNNLNIIQKKRLLNLMSLIKQMFKKKHLPCVTSTMKTRKLTTFI